MSHHYRFARRAENLRSSFIRDILRVANDPQVISFAGGLPAPELFPLEALAEAAAAVFHSQGSAVLQYSETPGEAALRHWIAERYRSRQGLEVSAEEIIITNGSQQALDLLGKVLLDTGDGVVLEAPGYLGAIQAFSLYRPTFRPVEVTDDGLDPAGLQRTLRTAPTPPKLLYTVPEFQNPTGISYSRENREAIAGLLRDTPTLLIEDNPYGELRYRGEATPSFRQLLAQQTVLLGSFSKTVAPAMRLGWLVASGELRDKLLIAKQAADLHSNALAQRVMAHYLEQNDLDTQLERLRHHYGRLQAKMRLAIEKHFPDAVRLSDSAGGMFLWATLPEPLEAMALFAQAIKQRVAFVPGDPFYVDRRRSNSLRLNFTAGSEAEIETGIARLGRLIDSMVAGYE
jgi:2-aminoadipate transaminase